MYEAKTSRRSMAVLSGLLLLSCLFIFGSFLFGGELLAFTDIGSDTYDQYLMHYQTIITHLREGSFSLWDFNNGFGINMFSLNLFDPFLMLLYLFGVLFGAERIYGILVFLQILRILLAGLAIYGFLSCFSLSERSKVLAAYAYGLCGYLVVWGQHYQFGTVVVLFPLLLLAAEKALRKTGWLLGLTLLCAVSSAYSLYLSYMQFLVLGFYILYRTAWNGRLFCKKGLARVGKAYGSMVLGIGIGLFSLLPNAMMILGVSGRVGGESLATKILRELRLYEAPYYTTLLKRFFSGNLQGINDYSGFTNYYEDPSVFLSVLFLFAAVQFCFFLIRDWVKSCFRPKSSSAMERFSMKQRLLLLSALALCAFVLLIPLGSLIFNGFAYPFSRQTFVCLPFFAWITAQMLHEALEHRRLSFPLLIVTAAGTAAFYFRMQAGADSGLAAALGVLAAGMALFLALGAFFGAQRFRTAGQKERRSGKHSFALSGRQQQICTAGLALCLVLTMSLDAYASYHDGRSVLTKAPSEYFDALYDGSVEEALSAIAQEDPSFYRVEKDYTVGTATSCLNALAQNYSGVSTYNSTLNTYTSEFVQKLWGNLEILNSAHLSFANAVTENFPASLCHVKYVLSHQSDLGVPGYELFGQYGSIYVHRNTRTEQLGKFYTSAFTTADYEAYASLLDPSALLSENLLCDIVPELTRGAADLSSYVREEAADSQLIERADSEDGHTVTLTLPQSAWDGAEDSLLLEFDLALPAGGSDNLYAEIGGHTTQLTSENGSLHAALTVPEGVSQVTLSFPTGSLAGSALENLRLYRQSAADLSSLSDGIHFDSCRRDSLVTGTAEVSSDGVLMLAIPYENGWHAYVDGEETEIHRVNYSFTGISLTRGSHEIRLEYRCPGFAAGVIGSAASLLLTAGIWGAYFLKRKRSHHS